MVQLRPASRRSDLYGESVDAAALIPLMLEAFMDGDRGFRRGKQASP
ncbi:DUF2274 domain-containing protein [Stenotrophomonas geniculata]